MTDRWTYVDGKVFDGNGILLAHVVYDHQTNFRRNCRMIAAAPDMLEALEAVTGESEESDYLTQAQIYGMCRSAIRKARGELWKPTLP